MSHLKLLFNRTATVGVFLSAWASAQDKPNGPVTSPLSSETKAAMMGKSWKPECPVALDDLASVRVTYIDFDGHTQEGKLIVHKRIADDTSKLFQELYSIRFPIHKVAPWEDYGPDVYAQQNITVGYYCEKADDAPTEWSSHAYGMAIDINPLLNPFLDLHHQWWPKIAAQNVARDSGQGKVSAQTEVFRIFTRHGWAWGGFDAGVPDYMHFNKVAVGDGAKMDRPYIVTGLQYIPNGATEAAQPKK
jgi:hypothetical protein